MPLHSMMGFARAEGRAQAANWFWEIRSVNGRGLDVRTRLPSGFEQLDGKIRTAISKRLHRGNVSANLLLQRDDRGGALHVNKDAIESILNAVKELRRHNEIDASAKLRPDTVLGLRGVLEAVDVEPSQAELDGLGEALFSSFESALEELVAARRQEGAQLETVLETQLSEIKRLVDEIENSPARTIEAVKARLSAQVSRLLEKGQELDPARLHQEVVLLATRADIEEEIERLRTHISAARSLLTETKSIGRKLDFLAQEFNREANTICSKSNDSAITQAGLALKVVIDQLREQVQNIE